MPWTPEEIKKMLEEQELASAPTAKRQGFGNVLPEPLPQEHPYVQQQQRASRMKSVQNTVRQVSGLGKAVTNQALGRNVPDGVFSEQQQNDINYSPTEFSRLMRESRLVDRQLRGEIPKQDMPATEGLGPNEHRDFASTAAKVLTAGIRPAGTFYESLHDNVYRHKTGTAGWSDLEARQQMDKMGLLDLVMKYPGAVADSALEALKSPFDFSKPNVIEAPANVVRKYGLAPGEAPVEDGDSPATAAKNFLRSLGGAASHVLMGPLRGQQELQSLFDGKRKTDAEAAEYRASAFGLIPPPSSPEEASERTTAGPLGTRFSPTEASEVGAVASFVTDATPAAAKAVTGGLKVANKGARAVAPVAAKAGEKVGAATARAVDAAERVVKGKDVRMEGLDTWSRRASDAASERARAVGGFFGGDQTKLRYAGERAGLNAEEISHAQNAIKEIDPRINMALSDVGSAVEMVSKVPPNEVSAFWGIVEGRPPVGAVSEATAKAADAYRGIAEKFGQTASELMDLKLRADYGWHGLSQESRNAVANAAGRNVPDPAVSSGSGAPKLGSHHRERSLPDELMDEHYELKTPRQIKRLDKLKAMAPTVAKAQEKWAQKNVVAIGKAQDEVLSRSMGPVASAGDDLPKVDNQTRIGRKVKEYVPPKKLNEKTRSFEQVENTSSPKVDPNKDVRDLAYVAVTGKPGPEVPQITGKAAKVRGMADDVAAKLSEGHDSLAASIPGKLSAVEQEAMRRQLRPLGTGVKEVRNVPAKKPEVVEPTLAAENVISRRKGSVPAPPVPAEALDAIATPVTSGPEKGLFGILNGSPQKRFERAVGRAEANVLRSGAKRPPKLDIKTIPEVNEAVAGLDLPTAKALRERYAIPEPGAPRTPERFNPGMFESDPAKNLAGRFVPAARENVYARFIDRYGRGFARPLKAGENVPKGWVKVGSPGERTGVLEKTLKGGGAEDIIVPKEFHDVVMKGVNDQPSLSALRKYVLNPWKWSVTVGSAPAYHLRNALYSAFKSAEEFGPVASAKALADADMILAGGKVADLPSDFLEMVRLRGYAADTGAPVAQHVRDIKMKAGLQPKGVIPEPVRNAAKKPGEFAQRTDATARLASAIAEFRRTKNVRGSFDFADKFITSTSNKTPFEEMVSDVSPFGVWSLRELANKHGVIPQTLKGKMSAPAKLQALAEAEAEDRNQVPEKYRGRRLREGLAMPWNARDDQGRPVYLPQPWSAPSVLSNLDPAYRMAMLAAGKEKPMDVLQSAVSVAARQALPHYGLMLQAGSGTNKLNGRPLDMLGKANAMEVALKKLEVPGLSDHVIKMPSKEGIPAAPADQPMPEEYKSTGFGNVLTSLIPYQHYARLATAQTPYEFQRALAMILGLSYASSDPELEKILRTRKLYEDTTKLGADRRAVTGHVR